MLVLSRKIGEEVTLTGGITVRLLRVNGGTVRLGFDAPPDVRISRDDANQKRRADRCSGRPSNSPGSKSDD